MATPFLGEIKIVSFNFPPRGWATCDGQTLSIVQNAALFSILGTTYGGNGTTTFALPNFQGRAPMHVGNGHVIGESGGEQNHTLLQAEMPLHNHTVNGNTNPGDNASPAGATWAKEPFNVTFIYSNDAPSSQMSPQAIGSGGSSQGHNNMQPYLVLNFIIALQGIFPSRN
jgi:microcystin-dependent protein